REDLARDLNAAPAITTSATAVAQNTGARATNITVHGIDSRMNALYDANTIPKMLSKPAGQIFQSVVITQALQKELGVKVGDTILLTLQKPGDIHPETVLGERDISNMVRKLRLIVRAIVSERGPGGLTLRPHQTSPQNAFVDLKVLQRSLESNSKVNTLYVNSNTSDPKTLSKAFQFSDSGLRTRLSNQDIIVESSEIILDPRLAAKAKQAAEKLGAKSSGVFTYLANTIRDKDRTVPYSTITAIETRAGTPALLGNDQILLNEWTAKDLQAKQGDEIEITYYALATGNQLVTRSAKFTVANIIPNDNFDTSFAPDYPGIQNAKHISDWNPPFPVDLKLIRPIDEEYWNQYHAAPKAIISLAAGQKLWSSRFGNLTSLRIFSPPGENVASFKQKYEHELNSLITPSDVGWVFQPIREQGLQAAQGSTDFGSLFAGFSFFLIVSAAMLSGLLFRLGAEQRSAELGTLLAIGYPTRSVSRRLLMEGLILAAIGILIGTALAAFYAWLMLSGLRSWWQTAIGSSYLQLY
ncbi:MAG TPA: FtsX-like permease family protein, partial [Acidobacteriota bacterium]